MISAKVRSEFIGKGIFVYNNIARLIEQLWIT